ALAHLKAEASRSELGGRADNGDYAPGEPWDEIKGLPSPPLSTGPLDSGDEVASISGEISGGRSDRSGCETRVFAFAAMPSV
ncbi:hypothetical protein FRC17_005595, partial [Serendipita sp. 399]